MDFHPRYTITDKLLSNIKRVNALVAEINSRRFPQIVLMEMEKTARAVSAHASTSIEGNPLPLTEVKKILKNTPVHIRDSEQEVTNYNQALQTLCRKMGKNKLNLSLNLILAIHKQVTYKLLPDFESGQIRQKPVVVNNPLTRQVVYLPPDIHDVQPLLKGLINYVNNNKRIVDPLILAGIFHKQMVIIHPFMDGNGRAARLATKVLLAAIGLNTFNLFSFENYYNQNVTKYFQTVGEFGDYYELKKIMDFTNWLEYFTEGIIDELLRVQGLLPKISTNPASELQPYHLKILETIRTKGFVADRDYANLTDRARATRNLDFRKLIKLGIIERNGKGKATYYTLK